MRSTYPRENRDSKRSTRNPLGISDDHCLRFAIMARSRARASDADRPERAGYTVHGALTDRVEKSEESRTGPSRLLKGDLGRLMIRLK